VPVLLAPANKNRTVVQQIVDAHHPINVDTLTVQGHGSVLQKFARLPFRTGETGQWQQLYQRRLLATEQAARVFAVGHVGEYLIEHLCVERRDITAKECFVSALDRGEGIGTVQQRRHFTCESALRDALVRRLEVFGINALDGRLIEEGEPAQKFQNVGVVDVEPVLIERVGRCAVSREPHSVARGLADRCRKS